MNRLRWNRALPGGGGRTLPLLLVAACACLACSTGDPDPDPADRGGRIGRTTADVDSALEPARARIRAIDSLGASVE